MNKTDLLFIRACKTENPQQRIKSLYRRFYLHPFDETDYSHFSYILLGIVEKHYPIETRDLINSLNPDKAWMYFPKDFKYSYYHLVCNVLISHLRLSEVNKLEGFISPLRYRR